MRCPNRIFLRSPVPCGGVVGWCFSCVLVLVAVVLRCAMPWCGKMSCVWWGGDVRRGNERLVAWCGVMWCVMCDVMSCDTKGWDGMLCDVMWCCMMWRSVAWCMWSDTQGPGADDRTKEKIGRPRTQSQIQMISCCFFSFFFPLALKRLPSGKQFRLVSTGRFDVLSGTMNPCHCKTLFNTRSVTLDHKTSIYTSSAARGGAGSVKM